MTPTTLVVGASPAAREAAIAIAIAAAIDSHLPTAVILEGIASGSSALESSANPDTLRVIRIAPGCMCCIGNLTLRVTLNRLLRKPPSRLFIALSTSTHLAQIRSFLSAEPYDAFLTLTADMMLIDTI
ncbi:MAG TPA: GTPase [Burkholderiaceae bacterium]|jgi:G3E family GTPase|nr:GTPase [Burkholderiaceae bacterium]